MSDYPLLSSVHGPAELKALNLEQLEQLASELRRCICDQISRTGGHFASNLGIVELTLALHYVFDFASDRLIFDVGHQCYPHKLVTGRQDLFARLKLKGGMAGFPDPAESDYDLFSVGHAGASISTAVGLARGDAAVGEGSRRVVAVIGDSSIVNGLAMEGLNNAGTLNRQLLVVLNDNGMAIAQPQGAMAQYFDRVRVSSTFGEVKKRGKEILERLPGGSILEDLYHRGSEMLRSAIATDHLFEHMGIACIGPIDGHDLRTLIDLFNEVKQIERPILIHAKTIKGKGYERAEGDPFRFHAPGPDKFVTSDCAIEKKPKGKSFTAAYADAMIDLMGRDDKIHAITAAMPDGTGLDKVEPHFPGRVIDCGLAESHGMAMAAGMARSGLKPFYAVYSTFSQRAFDQVFQEVCLQHLPVRVCMDRAGYVGGDGAPMHGFADIAIYRLFPDAVVMAASDEPNLRAALEFMRTYDKQASFVRYPRDVVPAEPIHSEVPPFEPGKALLMRRPRTEQPDLAILAYGFPVYAADAAMRDQLQPQGYDIALYDARFAKPLDIELVADLIERNIPILTIEDHGYAGGFGSAVLEAANERGLDTRLIHRHAMPLQWFRHDSRNGQLADAGLDAAGIARKVRSVLDAVHVAAEKAAESTRV